MSDRRRLERDLMAMARDGIADETGSRQRVVKALAYFHRLPERVCARNGGRMEIETDEEGYAVRWKEKVYWVPKPDRPRYSQSVLIKPNSNLT
jgi:hypothetical protein